MPVSRLESLRIKAKLLQMAKRRTSPSYALKDAFAIIAGSAGFQSWQAMKATVEAHEILRPAHSSSYWNVWYGSHEEGKAHIAAHGGFLLPYQKQFFVCDANYVSSLGLHLDDADLASVGCDWAMPADRNAWARLLRKIAAARDRS